MTGTVFFWLAIAFGAILVLAAIGLVIYMLGAGKEEAPENLVEVMQRETAEKEAEASSEQEAPESVFSMPGVKTVNMPSEQKAQASGSRVTARPSRREIRREAHSAPTVARNSAPRREDSYHELKEDDNSDFIPSSIRKPQPKAFSWEDEE